jgi:predicted RNase H-like HicB family nuclease
MFLRKNFFGLFGMEEFTVYGIIQKEKDRYSAMCLELDIATGGDSLEAARRNLKSAVKGYIELMQSENKEEKFIPEPMSEKLAKKYYCKFLELHHSEFYEFREISCTYNGYLQ